jgi:hypothetical protein
MSRMHEQALESTDIKHPGVSRKGKLTKLKGMIEEGGLSLCAYIQQGGDIKKAFNAVKSLARQREFERGKLLKNAGGT